ncbi:Enamine deaminase RidA, house cleaning of reactive enamine intermediates, YjgF/YER057c/UK114 family [Algoriphagus alkaliphilus]|uniref:Enamine deaminase RidA, house cleaning of reactive enamine intermediates, YjgF/YER057c/UK114 family n=1 Tax=Algoriphagus alkaliphilus TaxID=279824 RepID=A0A1G5WY11_9BACT|nr:RidA family protein [Algoriphagus alkaliphilus]MBA4301854.1 RidA family protein [Cyclobacterium sp.]SDA63078.1 Enamine deaminase RidA, house cleaning of reactive enamine intermediates, YjgF/YER057c/UK114 family [Algoriphagus alkaliphilus]
MKKILLTCLILTITGISLSVNAQTPEEKLEQMGLKIPEVGQPIANYVKWKQVGNLLYLAGSGPKIYGKVGADLSVEQGYEAARATGLEIIAVLKAATGDLSRIKQFVKVLGMVNATPEFTAQPAVINGFSDLMVEVFGEKGKHARSAVGVGSLPNNMAVEIEVIVELEEK